MPYVGGNANNGGNAGPEYLNVNNGVSTANVNYGSPLNFQRLAVDCLSPSGNRVEARPRPMAKDNS